MRTSLAPSDTPSCDKISWLIPWNSGLDPDAKMAVCWETTGMTRVHRMTTPPVTGVVSVLLYIARINSYIGPSLTLLMQSYFSRDRNKLTADHRDCTQWLLIITIKPRSSALVSVSNDSAFKQVRKCIQYPFHPDHPSRPENRLV